MESILSEHELRTLTDAELVALIVKRSNLDPSAAAEALLILKGEQPLDRDL